MNEYDLDAAIRRVPDFPKPGILFYDLTSILTNPPAFRYCVDEMHRLYDGEGFDCVAAIEARGFLFASPFALESKLPLLLLRKAGKLPGKTASKSFELEYGEDTIEMHVADLPRQSRVLLVDDLAATGGTTRAAIDLLMENGASSCEAFSVVGLPFLGYRERIAPIRISTLIEYHSE